MAYRLKFEAIPVNGPYLELKATEFKKKYMQYIETSKKLLTQVLKDKFFIDDITKKMIKKYYVIPKAELIEDFIKFCNIDMPEDIYTYIPNIIDLIQQDSVYRTHNISSHWWTCFRILEFHLFKEQFRIKHDSDPYGNLVALCDYDFEKDRPNPSYYYQHLEQIVFLSDDEKKALIAARKQQ